MELCAYSKDGGKAFSKHKTCYDHMCQEHSLHQRPRRVPGEDDDWVGTKRIPRLVGFLCPVVGCAYAESGTNSFLRKAALERHVKCSHGELELQEQQVLEQLGDPEKDGVTRQSRRRRRRR